MIENDKTRDGRNIKVMTIDELFGKNSGIVFTEITEEEKAKLFFG